MLSFGAVLRRCALAGALAGVAAALVSWLLVETSIRSALTIEQARAAAGGGHEHALVSRPMQVVGGMVVAVLAGLAFGVIFAVVFSKARHHLPGRTDFGRCLVLAATGFVVFALLPALKYPANPPAVGDPNTVGQRTALYGALLVLGVLVAVAVTTLHSTLVRRGWSGPLRSTAVTLAGAALLVLVLVLLPDSPTSIPPDIPAALLWQFRLHSLAELAALWSVLGLAAGLLLDRVARAGPRASGARPAAGHDAPTAVG